MLGIYYDKIGLWAYQKNRDLSGFSYSIRRNKLIQKLDRLICSILEFLTPKCWQKDCENKGEPCILRGDSNESDSIYWFCSEHSQRHGFCFGCGEFWGGTESFDFGPGYCSNCASEFEEEVYEDDWTY
jgi:hypothetical protein